jgi:hypothetical protein
MIVLLFTIIIHKQLKIGVFNAKPVELYVYYNYSTTGYFQFNCNLNNQTNMINMQNPPLYLIVFI